MTRYLDLDLPPLFALEIGPAGEEWGLFAADWFGREDDGSYVCAGHGGSPVYLRAVARDGQRFTHVDGGGRKHAYRLRIVDPSQVRDAGPAFVELAERNLRAPGAVGRLARAQHALLALEPLGAFGREPGGSAVYAIYVDESGWDDLLQGAYWPQFIVFSPPSDSACEPGPSEDFEPVSSEEAFSVAEPIGGDPTPWLELSYRRREPLYIGRGAHHAERALKLLLTDGATPNSGLRRVLAALVGWRYDWCWEPSSHSPDGRPASLGVERFTLKPQYEAHLTSWMRDHLSVGRSADPAMLDTDGFNELVRYLRPPLRSSAGGADPFGRMTRHAIGTLRSSIGWTGWPEDRERWAEDEDRWAEL